MAGDDISLGIYRFRCRWHQFKKVRFTLFPTTPIPPPTPHHSASHASHPHAQCQTAKPVHASLIPLPHLHGMRQTLAFYGSLTSVSDSKPFSCFTASTPPTLYQTTDPFILHGLSTPPPTRYQTNPGLLWITDLRVRQQNHFMLH